MKRQIVLFLLMTTCALASEEEYARNREVRLTPNTYSITADYPAPHGKTTVIITSTHTNGDIRIRTVLFTSQAVSIAIPESLTVELTNPQLDHITLTYSSGMRTGEGIYASVTIPWGHTFTNTTHQYQERTFCIVGSKLAFILNKRPKDNWYETELIKTEAPTNEVPRIPHP